MSSTIAQRASFVSFEEDFLEKQKAPEAQKKTKECIICCEALSYVAVGKCKDTFCWLCAMRLRVLKKELNCPYCKIESPKLILTSKEDVEYESVNLSDFLRDESDSLYFENEEIRDVVKKIHEFRCWDQSCVVNDTCFPTMEDLERHLKLKHGLRFCHTCLGERNTAFIFQQRLYTQQDIVLHRTRGDEEVPSNTRLRAARWPPLGLHPRCKFCAHISYDGEAEWKHMRLNHYQCDVCQELFQDYQHMRAHQKLQHFICENDACPLMAFATQAELRVHEAEVHSVPRNRRGQIVVESFFGSPSQTFHGDRVQRRNEVTVRARSSPMQEELLAQRSPEGGGTRQRELREKVAEVQVVTELLRSAKKDYDTKDQMARSLYNALNDVIDVNDFRNRILELAQPQRYQELLAYVTERLWSSDVVTSGATVDILPFLPENTRMPKISGSAALLCCLIGSSPHRAEFLDNTTRWAKKNQSAELRRNRAEPAAASDGEDLHPRRRGSSSYFGSGKSMLALRSNNFLEALQEGLSVELQSRGASVQTRKLSSNITARLRACEIEDLVALRNISSDMSQVFTPHLDSVCALRPQFHRLSRQSEEDNRAAADAVHSWESRLKSTLAPIKEKDLQSILSYLEFVISVLPRAAQAREFPSLRGGGTTTTSPARGSAPPTGHTRASSSPRQYPGKGTDASPLDALSVSEESASIQADTHNSGGFVSAAKVWGSHKIPPKAGEADFPALQRQRIVAAPPPTTSRQNAPRNGGSRGVVGERPWGAWKCSYCTYDNSMSRRDCELCARRRD